MTQYLRSAPISVTPHNKDVSLAHSSSVVLLIYQLSCLQLGSLPGPQAGDMRLRHSVGCWCRAGLPNQTMVRRPKWASLQRRHTGGQLAHEKMLNITTYWRNANQNYNEVPPHTRVRMAVVKKFTNNKCWKGCGEKGTLLHCWWECKLVQPLWRTVWRVLTKLNIELPYDPAIPLLGIYPDRTIIQKDTRSPMFTTALFTTVKTWKQSKCPSTDERIKKMWCIYTMEHYSAIEKNETMPFAATWMQLEMIILSEVNQKEKDKYHMISLIRGI